MAEVARDPLKWFVDNIPKHGVCSYYIELDDGTTLDWSNDACHARALASSLAFQTNKDVKAVYNGLYYKDKCTREAAIAWWDYLLDPKRSPYRQALKEVKVWKDKDDTPVGMAILDTDVPSILVGSLLIALRYPWEWSYKPLLFLDAIKAGFKEAEAFWLACICEYDGKTCSVHSYQMGHMIMEYAKNSINYDYSSKDYGKINKNYIPTSLKNIADGTLNMRDDVVKAMYKKRKGHVQSMSSLYNGNDLIKHPFDLDYKTVATFKYEGRFSYLAKTMPDFPADTKEADDYPRVTLQQLFDRRKEWSPLA